MAYPAYEAIGMPLGVQSGNVVFHDCAIASSAFWSKHVEVVITTIRLAFAFMKTIFSKLLSTLRTEEMFHMPGLLQGSHAFLKQVLK